MQTQKEMVLAWLKTRGSITPLEAMKELGIMRLGARIFDLRAEGYPIISSVETAQNRFGTPTTYARYILKGGANDE